MDRENLNLDYHLDMLVGKALEQSEFNIDEAAKLMSIHPRTMYRYVKRFNYVYVRREKLLYKKEPDAKRKNII